MGLTLRVETDRAVSMDFRLLITSGLRLLTVVVDETPVLGVFTDVTGTLVEVGTNELGFTGGDR